MKKKYVVTLTEEERARLRGQIGAGKGSARKLMHARILLKADEGPGEAGWSDAAIAEALDAGHATVERVRQRFVEEGLASALSRRLPRRVYRRKIDGEAEARLVALACSEAPEGRDRWTLQLLADQLVRLEVVDSICPQTVRRTLKKTNSNPTVSNAG